MMKYKYKWFLVVMVSQIKKNTTIVPGLICFIPIIILDIEKISVKKANEMLMSYFSSSLLSLHWPAWAAPAAGDRNVRPQSSHVYTKPTSGMFVIKILFGNAELFWWCSVETSPPVLTTVDEFSALHCLLLFSFLISSFCEISRGSCSTLSITWYSSMLVVKTSAILKLGSGFFLDCLFLFFESQIVLGVVFFLATFCFGLSKSFFRLGCSFSELNALKKKTYRWSQFLMSIVHSNTTTYQGLN